jgi:hypothetical protein
VTADEIALFRTLTWLRRFGRPGPESMLNPPPHVPVLDVAVLQERREDLKILGAICPNGTIE